MGASNDIVLIHIPKPPNQAWISRVEAKFPGLKVRWIQREYVDPRISPVEYGVSAADWEGVTVVVTFMPHPREVMQDVRYVQLTSAGADKWLGHPVYENPEVIFCNSSGIHPPQIAEWVIGSYLMMSHKFLHYAQVQSEAKWARSDDDSVLDGPGMRMGILGYGAIGRQVAKMASAMGMEVYAYTRSEKATAEQRKDTSYCMPGLGDPDGLIPTKWFYGASKEAINDFLAQDLDILVVSLPLTESTKYIIGKEQFDILAKKKTFLSNIARGKHVDTDALLEALKDGKIRGAALDVTDPEPLPDGHPLFAAPNVFITPHVSWMTPKYYDRLLAILETNLEKLEKGEPLINVINREHHY